MVDEDEAELPARAVSALKPRVADLPPSHAPSDAEKAPLLREIRRDFGRFLLDGPFVDEYAYISQSYFVDLLLEGKTNDRAWLDLMGYDLVPLPKYLIGLALRAGGYGRPGPDAALLWYNDSSTAFGPPGLLTAARIPSVLLGAAGCVVSWASAWFPYAAASATGSSVASNFLFILSPFLCRYWNMGCRSGALLLWSLRRLVVTLPQAIINRQ